MEFTILILDDELEVCLSLSEILNSEGFTTLYDTNPLNAIDIIKNNKIDLVIIDIKMPNISGIELLKIIKGEIKSIPIIVISGYATVEEAVVSIKYGALNLYTKPIKIPKLLEEIKNLSISLSLKHDVINNNELITQNTNMISLLELSKKAAPTNASVIISGESGTGKELISDILHNYSNRKNLPYIKINCAAIPDNLLESEIFGYEKGAFTDAKTQKKGKFELAGNGTIFLDEIGDMSVSTQAKMLRILQEKQFTRLGGSEIIKADFRIISATNKNLQDIVAKGLFREDLYYRLSVITLNLPPLRDRSDDIIPLTNYFINHFNKVYSKSVKKISEKVELLLLSYSWPGNIRELQNFEERAVIFCSSDIIDFENLPDQYKTVITNTKQKNLSESYENFTKEIILDALKKTDGIKNEAAKLLNINRKTLYNKMRKLQIK